MLRHLKVGIYRGSTREVTISMNRLSLTIVALSLAGDMQKGRRQRKNSKEVEKHDLWYLYRSWESYAQEQLIDQCSYPHFKLHSLADGGGRDSHQDSNRLVICTGTTQSIYKVT